MSDYDMSIHHNPDAKAWAEFFEQHNPDSGIDHEVMVGWFANAMMAMHDHLTPRIEALQAALAQAEAERNSLAGIVRGWHYLAVGPDEMGDYYTHKQLVKASEPYASPALRTMIAAAQGGE